MAIVVSVASAEKTLRGELRILARDARRDWRRWSRTERFIARLVIAWSVIGLPLLAGVLARLLAG